MSRREKSSRPAGDRQRNSEHAPSAPTAAEAGAWQAIGDGWRPLFGHFSNLGFSFEWHDFQCAKDLDWGRSFHPGRLELCLNLEGNGMLQDAQMAREISARTWVMYFQGNPPLQARRAAGQRQRFVTVEYSAGFLEQHFSAQTDHLHPQVRAVARGEAETAWVAAPERINTSLLPLVESLRHCPVYQPAQEVWFRCKALELAAQLFIRPPNGDLFCTRTQRAARERIEQTRAILKERLQDPPLLDELGRLVGYSSFYLSRLFSQETGMTIQQYIRQIRMERAAELLRTGQCNVTEAALEVGYNSLSHFSAAFHETFGCCPGLYPLKTPTQKANPDSEPVPASPIGRRA